MHNDRDNVYIYRTQFKIYMYILKAITSEQLMLSTHCLQHILPIPFLSTIHTKYVNPQGFTINNLLQETPNRFKICIHLKEACPY